MYLEAITVSVGYSDFLSHFLLHNKHFFDNLVVVTSTTDLETKNLCDFHNVHCVQTDAFYNRGAKLNKAAGINEGLKHLSRKGWVLHIDSDVILPAQFRNILQQNELQEHGIYGIDRYMVRGYEEWISFLEKPKLQHEAWIYVHTTHFPIGTRIAKYKSHGFLPLGFFQLWNPKGSGIHTYPEQQFGAVDHDDLMMAQNFVRKDRHLIPEIIGYHLESEACEMGTNWEGRKTKKFVHDQKVNVLLDKALANTEDRKVKVETVKIKTKTRGYLPQTETVFKVVFVTLLAILVTLLASYFIFL